MPVLDQPTSSSVTIGDVRIISDPTVSDPSTGSGVAADLGSLFVGEPGLWQKTSSPDTGWAPVGGGTGALSASVVASGSVNLSTLGTIDWVFPTAASADPVTTSSTTHSKIGGGWLRTSFQWIQGGSATVNTSPNTITTTNTDDVNASALNTTQIGGFSESAGSTGFGFCFRVPAATTSRVLRIQTMQYNNTITLTARLSDGSATPITLTNTVSQNNSNVCFVVPFTGGTYGAELIVDVQVTARSASAPNPNSNLFCEGISLGTA